MRAACFVVVACCWCPAAGAQTRPWAVAVEGGARVSDTFETAGTAALSLSRELGRYLELGGTMGVAATGASTELRAVAGAGLRLKIGGPLRLGLAGQLGYAAIQVKRESSLWTGALVLAARLELRLQLGRRWELRAAPLALSLYWNDLWLRSWEPSTSLALRF